MDAALNRLKSNFNFIEEVENLRSGKKIEYIEAIVLWCERYSIDVETVASWIKTDPVMKAKVQVEAENLNILKRSARLPL